jgi:hypothetical protein
MAPQLRLSGLPIGAIAGETDCASGGARHLADLDQPARAADDHVPAFARAGAGSQFPAFRDNQIGGRVEGARISSVAIDEDAVGASPPHRQRNGVEHLAQIGGFLARPLDRYRSRSVEQPQHSIAARCTPPFNGIGSPAAGNECGRKSGSPGLQRQPGLFQPLRIRGQQSCEELAIGRRIIMRVSDRPTIRPTGAPAKPFERGGFEYRGSRTFFGKLGAGAQQSGN